MTKKSVPYNSYIDPLIHHDPVSKKNNPDIFRIHSTQSNYEHIVCTEMNYVSGIEVLLQLY